MISPTIRHRLEALNRTTYAPRAANPAIRTATQTPAWEERACVVGNHSGEHLMVRVELAELWRSSSEMLSRHAAAPASDHETMHPELAAMAGNFPVDVMFLDLETCGFAGSAIFLIGLLREAGGELVIEQLLARSYAEERAILETMWRLAAQNRVLATFNGKSFDWPMVHDRSTLHHLGRDARPGRGRSTRRNGSTCEKSDDDTARQTAVAGGPMGRGDRRPELIHFDLLHHARRRWKQRLPNCKLQTLETYLCGRRRSGDIPGSRIPAVYHDYVRSGNLRELHSILHHNLLDLVTLLQVSMRLLE